MPRFAPVTVRPDGRVFIGDHKPYVAPDSLDELRGPSEGIFVLPHSVRWLNEKARTTDVTNKIRRRCAYRDLLAEGTYEQQCEFINRDLLIRDFPHLPLPRRVTKLWTDAFPELVSGG
ncbi:hypothetical protein M0E87_02740 [Corynebacterium sp. CCM 9185]|uniref:Uncharacterized protein n=1 Tax=Corynebacterium marambiense TaxID=2765364 RepID=A0ABS0VSJ3_9CORY|nr:hypothetical protein [Corynebacterium marambiense]MBI8999743.1 hypothetical protein [Corynebacterium marambiense]MCK7662583.1 hypothetical protein [Corynebacterium marambiense]MCX7543590.1 hypothetical protein [Corynebacterium marambiense]